MEIIWTLPEIDVPATGGERFYAELKRILGRRAKIIRPAGLNLAPALGFWGAIRANISNFKIFCSSRKNALIFQDLYYRRRFLLSNIILSIIFRRKIVIFVNDQYPLSGFSLGGRIIRIIVNNLLFRLSHKIIVNSRSTACWVNSFGKFKGKVFVLYPILKHFSGNERGGGGSNESDKVWKLLCVANVQKRKGLEYLIDAIKLIKNTKIKLDLVGVIKDEGYDRYLKTKIYESGLGSGVECKGYLSGDELWKAYRDADLFVLPSLIEAYGMVLIEAMSFGLPIIASRVGGIPEIVEDGVNGLLVRPADPAELAKAIEEVVNNSQLRRNLSVNVLKTYRQMPDFEKSVNNLIGFLIGNGERDGQIP